jgi:dihydrofolate reductase
MRKITVFEMITLDGVIQSPGSPEEDAEGGFALGGWVGSFFDEIYSNTLDTELFPADYLLGRKTYEIWANYWPSHDAFWPSINANMKYVLSRNLTDASPLVAGWPHSKVVHSVEEIRKVKESEGKDLHVWGSSELVQLLVENDWVDELRLKIHPILLGKGKKLFNDGALPAAFELTETTVTRTGVIIAAYRRAGEVKTRRIEQV